MKLSQIVAATAALVAAGVASAALPTEASEAFTTLQADGLTLIGYGWPLAGGLALIGVFKKVLGRAS